MSLFSAGKQILDSHQPPADSTATQCDADGCLTPLKELRLFLGDRWIISVGDVDSEDYATLAERVNRQVFSRGRGSSFIAYHVCDWLVESLQPGIEELDDRIDQLEDEVVLNSRQDAVRGLFSLKKDIVELRRQVSPVRDVMQRLGSHGVEFIEPEAEVYFRDVHDDVMRVIELLDTYRDILSSALDLHLSSVSNRLNVVMKQLTVVATAFLPLTFLVGLFGTNFTRMPYASWGWFLAMWILMLLSVAVIALYTRKRT
jgi:magnesium transporter